MKDVYIHRNIFLLICKINPSGEKEYRDISTYARLI